MCNLQVYAPNMELQYEAFLEEVEVALRNATSSESLVLLGDFNAHVGIDNVTWKGVIGNAVTVTLTRTEGVYCSSVPPIGCA